MHTRCPGCHTVHPVNALLLAQDRGKYRCGKCKQINNALESLFDDWPDPGDRPPVAGKLPLLGARLDLEAAKQARLKPGQSSLSTDVEDKKDQHSSKSTMHLRAAWISALLVLIFLVTVYFAKFFQQPLPNTSTDGGMQTRTEFEESSISGPFRNLDQLQLLSRDMRSHAAQSDVLSLSLTIVNRASRSQAYPDLDVILLDSGGQILVSHIFKPQEYLAEGTEIETGMSPDVYLYINMDLADPGRQAVGFELNFQ